MDAGVILRTREPAMPVRRGRPARHPRRLSLRARLLSGAGLIAAIALGAAGLGAWAASAMQERVDAAAAAQARLETLGTLSARINDYALVAVEAAGEPEDARRARLTSRADVVQDTFAKAGEGLAQAVDAAREMPEIEQMARASRSLGLARLEAQFEALHRRLTDPAFRDAADALRSELDSFATRFSPLLDRQITEERQAREAAYAAVRDLSATMTRWATALGAAAMLALALFQTALVRPLIRRLSRFTAAARQIGAGKAGVRLPTVQHDELGLAAGHLNRMAARLDQRSRRVADDRRRLEQVIEERTAELRAANHRLERIDRSRRRFFADIGHELRTPLTVIRAEAELGTREDAPRPETVRHSFGTILARARRLNRRVDDLLRVARSESGEIALDERPFDLTAAAREAVEDCQDLAARRRIALKLDPHNGPQVRGDADWTRQVISGVIDNAIRHSPDEGRVLVTVGPGSVQVADEGPGVAERDRERIFRRFERGERHGEGFGIGLALARWVMKQQGGGIGCESPARAFDAPRGPGACFRLTLPLASPP